MKLFKYYKKNEFSKNTIITKMCWHDLKKLTNIVLILELVIK